MGRFRKGVKALREGRVRWTWLYGITGRAGHRTTSFVLAVSSLVLVEDEDDSPSQSKQSVTSVMSTVSAQSAFWAVIALALNTACQPAGSVLSSQAAHSRALRTSPIVCLADATVTLLTLVTLLGKGNGVRNSARMGLYW